MGTSTHSIEYGTTKLAVEGGAIASDLPKQNPIALNNPKRTLSLNS
jgi:hypothetical protein